jgi:ubiquitin-conjugating enzyme E2 J1
VALRAFMETDAKGQLGGLECSIKERERMAVMSAGWRCGVCGKSNEEIMKECEEAAKAKGGEGKAEVVVPSELKMAWKDEIGKDKEEGELAEGFVRTGNDRAADAPVYPPARPVQTVPQPTAAVNPPRIQNYPQMAQRSNDGVPMWIDKTIAAVVLCLVAMVLKVLLGL